MKRLILTLLTLSLSAHAGSTYDADTGNWYFTHPTIDGGVNVQGLNPGAGSQWNTTIKPNGNQSGRDSDGNFWNYNSNTGMYVNPGAGVFCTGRGIYRQCN